MSIVQLGLLSALAAPFGVAIWVAARRWPLPPGLLGDVPDANQAWTADQVEFAAAETLDAEPIIRTIADEALELARANFVRLELAISPGIRMRMSTVALRNALRKTVRNAIDAAPGGDVLITATMIGSQLHINVTDDGANADQGARESQTRDVETLLALQGGSVVVMARSGVGTTVTLRLPPVSDSVTDENELKHSQDWAELVT